MSGEVPIPDHIPREQGKILVKLTTGSSRPSGMIEERDEDGEVVDYKANKSAENKKHMLANYYDNLIRGKTKAGLMSML